MTDVSTNKWRNQQSFMKKVCGIRIQLFRVERRSA
jgi:hypothetical protein